MTEPVLYTVEAGVATLVLNRPDVLNALNSELVSALGEAVKRAATDPAVRAVVLTGAGRGFSAGADLKRPHSGGNTAAELLRTLLNPLILSLRALPKPLITVVNGVAAGAGMSLALAGDVVLAAQSATFVPAFTKIGLVPDAGSTYFLPRYAGEMRARAIAILGEKIDAAEAQRMGLVWKVHADDELASASAALARHLAEMPTRAYALTKAALNASLDHDLATQLDREATLQAEAVQTHDVREALAAFVEKRTARFLGR